MPRKIQYTKKRIVQVAIDIIRKDGASFLSSRSISKALGCSISPIFRTYSTMDDLLEDVRKEVERIFLQYVSDVCSFHPAFKEFGMRLIRFSKLEPKLFCFMFLETKVRNEAVDNVAKQCLEQTKVTCGITSEQAQYLYSQSWPYVVGLAALCNKGSGIFTEEYVSYSLSMQFAALITLIKSGIDVPNIEPHLIPEGENVFLRKWHESDAAELYSFSKDSELLTYSGWHPHKNEDESRDIIRRYLSRDAIWAVVEKESGRIVGGIGYEAGANCLLDIADDEAEVGYWIPKPFWSQELCLEALGLLIGHCRNLGIFKALYSAYRLDHQEYGEVLEKSGFIACSTGAKCPALMPAADKGFRVMKLDLSE
ncbi:MAG: GNAT family N-acetyltransferase [Candidatus Cryptobacteroides sp.]